MKRVLFVACAALLLMPSACGKKSDTKGGGKKVDKKPPETVLSRIEKFKKKGSDKEPYDYIKLTNRAKAAGVSAPGRARPLPPTLTDALMVDFQLIAKVDLKMTLDKSVTEAQMNKVVAFYAKTKPGGIRGLRPKTHKAFIDSLSEADRKKLAKEATAYVNKNDFKKK